MLSQRPENSLFWKVRGAGRHRAAVSGGTLRPVRQCAEPIHAGSGAVAPVLPDVGKVATCQGAGDSPPKQDYLREKHGSVIGEDTDDAVVFYGAKPRLSAPDGLSPGQLHALQSQRSEHHTVSVGSRWRLGLWRAIAPRELSTSVIDRRLDGYTVGYRPHDRPLALYPRLGIGVIFPLRR